MKVLITGSHGFLGSNLREFISLWKTDWEVLTPTSKELNLIDRLYEDTTSQGDIEDYLMANKPDVIVHMAAKCGGISANLNAPYEYCFANARMGQNLINACMSRYKPKLFLNLGTVCSYPLKPPRIPFMEEDIFEGLPEKSNFPYGEAKRYVMTLGEAARSNGLNFHTLMMTNAYGPFDSFDDNKSHVIPALIKKIDLAKNNNTELRVFGTGTATRDFIFGSDAACAIVRAIEVLTKGMNPLNNQPRINVGTGVETSIRELVNYLILLMDFRGRVFWDRTKPDGQPRRVLNTSLMNNHANWMPLVSLPEGLRRTIEYYRTL